MLRHYAPLVLVLLVSSVFPSRVIAAGDSSFTPIVALPAPQVIGCAEEYPGGSYAVGHLVDDREASEFASNGQGTDTFVDFDFGQPVAIRGFQHVDRRDVATVCEAELIFSDQRDFGAPLAREIVVHANASGAKTVALFDTPHTARFVRWKVTRLNAAGHNCLGGRDIRFFASHAVESSLGRDRVVVQAKQAVQRRDGAGMRPIVVQVEHAYAEPADVVLKVGELPPIPLHLKFGNQAVEVFMPAVDQPQSLEVAIDLAGATVLQQQVDVPPVRHWELHFLAHSHVDIGYTHVQTEVEQMQWGYLRQAIEIARNTADYPPAARFKWNSEVLWAVDSYLKQASDDEKAEFLQAVRSGVIHLDGLYGNELTALCRPEELMRLTSCARQISRQYDLPIDAAMISDVPGYTWGAVPALVQSGIKYLSIGPNHVHRIGGTLEQWGDRPFYWVSPAGDQRLLCWMAGKAYSWFHGSRVGTLSRDSKPDPFFEYLDELLEQEYPYDLVQIRYSIGGDNGPPDQELSEFVKAWNEQYEWPKMTISTTSHLMHAFEDRYAQQIPEVQGDFTPYWEDGAASSARETAMTRGAAERLVQAESLWTMRQPKAYPAEDFYAAWRDAMLFNEHTWGAHCSITQPDSPLTVDQWKIKQAFAFDASRRSKDLLQRALPQAPADNAQVEAVDVWNTTSWIRSDLVRLETDRPLVGLIVKDLHGNVVPSQRTPRGQLAFLAKDVPPFAAKRFLLEAGEPDMTGDARATETGLSNKNLKVEIDPDTGAIASLRLAGVPVDLVDNRERGGLNRYSYVAGRTATVPGSSRVTRIEVLEDRGIAATVAVHLQGAGARQLVTILRVVDGIDRVDIINILDKEKVLDKESVHLGFPFQVPDGTMRVNTPWAVVVPETDQFPGACKNYLTVGRWVDVSNSDFGVTWTTLDAPLIEVGGIHVDVPTPLFSEGWIKRLEPTQTLYSYVMNNYWETNYRASQEGITLFRYSILPHLQFDQAAAARFAINRSQPLLAYPANQELPVQKSCLTVSGQDVLVTSLKPSDDGKALIVRLFNAGDRPATAELDWPQGVPKQVSLSSPREEVGKPLSGPVSLGPLGIVTLRADVEFNK